MSGSGENYPIGGTPLQIARVIAILPPAGAWDAAPIALFCAGFRTAMFYIAYIGPAGGAVNVRIQWSPFAVDSVTYENWYTSTLYVAGGIVGPVLNADARSLIQRETITYGVTLPAVTESIIYGPLTLDATAQRMRVACQEIGVPANPGLCSVLLHCGGGV